MEGGASNRGLRLEVQGMQGMQGELPSLDESRKYKYTVIYGHILGNRQRGWTSPAPPASPAVATFCGGYSRFVRPLPKLPRLIMDACSTNGAVSMNTTKHHAYIHPLQKLLAEHQGQFRAGTVHEVTVAHDSWCGVFRGQVCCCSPELTLTDRTAPETEPSTGA